MKLWKRDWHFKVVKKYHNYHHHHCHWYQQNKLLIYVFPLAHTLSLLQSPRTDILVQLPVDPFVLPCTSPTSVEVRPVFYRDNFQDQEVCIFQLPSQFLGLGTACQELPATPCSLNSKSLGFALLNCGIGWNSPGLGAILGPRHSWPTLAWVSVQLCYR